MTEPEGPFYVVVNIGCLECGEPSHVLGIYMDQHKAESVRDLVATPSTQHDTVVFTIDTMGVTNLEGTL